MGTDANSDRNSSVFENWVSSGDPLSALLIGRRRLKLIKKTGRAAGQWGLPRLRPTPELGPGRSHTGRLGCPAKKLRQFGIFAFEVSGVILARFHPHPYNPEIAISE